MESNLPNIEFRKNEIIHTPSASNNNYGLAIDGTMWSIDHEGNSIFKSITVDGVNIDPNKNYDNLYVTKNGNSIVTGNITSNFTNFGEKSLITKEYVDTIANLKADKTDLNRYLTILSAEEIYATKEDFNSIDLNLYIPNIGNTKNDLDFTLSRKNINMSGSNLNLIFDDLRISDNELHIYTKNDDHITKETKITKSTLGIYDYDTTNNLITSYIELAPLYLKMGNQKDDTNLLCIDNNSLSLNNSSSALHVTQNQFALYGKDTNSGSSYNIDNDKYDLALNPGGITISTNNSSSKTYLNLTMGTIESKSTWDGYVDGIAAHKVYASNGEFYTLAKNPGGYAYQYTNYAKGFSGIKLLGNTLQQFTISDRNYTGSTKLETDYESFDNVTMGLQYNFYYSKDSMGTVNDDGFNTDNNYCKFLVTNGNFGYDYNYKDSSKNLTISSIHLNPNNFNVNSSHTDNYGENFTLQAHYNQFGYSSISNTYTYGETTTRDSTQTTLLQTTSTGGLHYSIETDNYTPAGTFVNLGLIINTSTIDIYAGDGNYIPKSRLYMTPTTAKITGEYNNNTYTLEWKWMQGPTLGLYASSTDGYTPVLKGFKVYDEDDNLISDSYLPLTGGTVTGNTYIETDYSAYDTLKGKTSLNSGAIYLELLDAPTYGTWNSQLGMSASSGITWSRNQITGSHSTKYQTHVQLIDSGYYLYTKDTSSNKADAIYLQSGQLELVNNGVTDTSHAEGQVDLSTTSLYIRNGNNQVNLSCDPSNIQLYLSGANQTIRLSKDGLTFNGDNIPVESLYFSSNGIGYTTKEAYGRKTTYYLTKSGNELSYKNQSQTGTMTFKPVTVDGEVQFKVANTINDTTHEVTMYNGHTSTTQTEFNNNDYVTKEYVDSIKEEYDELVESHNALLEAYNDLAERLNQFLLNTGEVTPYIQGE